MKEKIIEKIKYTIKKYEMIKPGDGIVAGLSGGPDSVCLFHALCTIKDELQIGDITAVHINHRLRGSESDGDEAFARELAERMGADFRVFRYDVAKIASETGEGTEAAGRRLRYAAFEQVRREKGAARIAVAHNMNDQAETVLMRIMRGTGLKGLSGIDFIRADGIVIRPVLGLTREEIECYCDENGLKPHIDSTNKKAIYTRNKIRLKLLPEMQQEYNPNIIEALVRLSAQAGEDEDFIHSEAVKFIDNSKSQINDAAGKRWDKRQSSLSLKGFSELHSAVAKRVIMICAERAGMEQNMSSVNLESVFEIAVRNAEKKEADLSDGYYARVSYGKLWFLRHKNMDAPEEDRETALPVDELRKTGCAAAKLGENLIRFEVMSAADVTYDKRSTILLDFDRIEEKENVVLRYRQSGDRISPIGMKGSKKLQDFFTDRKIPKHLRDDVILIASEGRVIAAGKEVSSECCINAETKRILCIEYSCPL
jgi:tRNA(Ile)-lysidine synthase